MNSDDSYDEKDMKSQPFYFSYLPRKKKGDITDYYKIDDKCIGKGRIFPIFFFIS